MSAPPGVLLTTMSRLEQIAVAAFPDIDGDEACDLIRSYLRSEIARRRVSAYWREPDATTKYSDPTREERVWVTRIPAPALDELLAAVSAVAP